MSVNILKAAEAADNGQPRIFSSPLARRMAKEAGIAEREMLRTFNCGIGLVAVVAAADAGHVIDAFQEGGDKAVRLGELVPGSGEAKVVYQGALKL